MSEVEKCHVCGRDFEECVCTADDRVYWMIGK